MKKRIAKKILKHIDRWFRTYEDCRAATARYTERQYRSARARLFPPGHLGRYMRPRVSLIQDQSLRNLQTIDPDRFLENAETR